MAKSSLTKKQEEELKNLLLESNKNLRETIEVLDKQDPFKDPEHVLDNAAIDTDIREQMGHDTIEAEVKALQKKLDLVENALRKMDKGTYGVCEKTKKPIPYERLKVVPEARYSIEYEREAVK